MHKAVKYLMKLQRRYSKAERGWREAEYAIMAEAMSKVIELRKDAGALSEFTKIADVERPSAKSLTLEVIAYVTGATSVEARHIAWKRARALDYLVDVKNVDLEDIAREIKNRGGIEALVSEAAQQDPRKNKTKSVATKLSNRAAKSGGNVKEDNQDENDDASGADDDQADEPEEQVDDDGDSQDDNQDQDDDKDTMVISINARLRKKFRKIDIDERAKLIGRRLNDDDGRPTFEVERVVKVK